MNAISTAPRENPYMGILTVGWTVWRGREHRDRETGRQRERGHSLWFSRKIRGQRNRRV